LPLFISLSTSACSGASPRIYRHPPRCWRWSWLPGCWAAYCFRCRQAPPCWGIGQTLLDFLLMLGVLHVALKFTDKLPRFLQTATALVGADTLVGIVALVPVGLAGPSIDDSPRLLLAG
jgi:hypothetical protein